MNTTITLHDYQFNTVKRTAEALRTHNRVLVVLPTGGGKSVVIAYIANNINGRTLILTHRAEILKQNSEWLNDVGVLTRTRNEVKPSNKNVIAMVQTLYARVKKHGIGYIGAFDNIIVDEAHVDIFKKMYELYQPKRLIGFTATPTISKRVLVEIDGIEYYKTVTLKEQYDKMVEGATVPELILGGFLVEDHNFALQLPGMENLEDSNTNPDGYTSESLTKVYSNKASLKILGLAYDTYCVGKKTLIFNATTAVNPLVQDFFAKKGIKTESFDSVHNKNSDRHRVIKWFENTRDAVLVGTNVFTTGFNVNDIEVVIVNRATKSFALWIQMVGRGSRTTKKIFKNHFVVIDLGQNIHRHGLWSDKIDWESHFEPPDLVPRVKKDVMTIWECEACGAYNANADLKCIVCGAEKSSRTTIKRPDKDGVIVEINKTIFPRAKRLIEYTKLNGEGSTFAFSLLIKTIVNLFKEHEVPKEQYVRLREKFIDRVRKISTPIYFAIIKAGFKGKHKKLQTFYDELEFKIDEYYGIKNS